MVSGSDWLFIFHVGRAWFVNSWILNSCWCWFNGAKSISFRCYFYGLCVISVTRSSAPLKQSLCFTISFAIFLATASTFTPNSKRFCLFNAFFCGKSSVPCWGSDSLTYIFRCIRHVSNSASALIRSTGAYIHTCACVNMEATPSWFSLTFFFCCYFLLGVAAASATHPAFLINILRTWINNKEGRGGRKRVSPTMASFWSVKFIWTHFLELFQHSTETLAMQQTQNPHFYLEIFLLGFFFILARVAFKTNDSIGGHS